MWGILLALLVAITFVYAIRQRSSRKKYPLPPGPPGKPIIGNILEVTPGAWLKFTEYRETYGKLAFSVIYIFAPFNF